MRKLILILLVWSSVLPASAAIEFTGILVTPGQTWFSLADYGRGRSDWVTMGDVFFGNRLSEYDPETEVLTLLQEGGTVVRLRLKSARSRDSYLDFSGELYLGEAEPLQVDRITLPIDVETVLPLSPELVFRIVPRRLRNGDLFIEAALERRDADGTVDTVRAPRVVTRPNQGFTIVAGGLRFALRPNPL